MEGGQPVWAFTLLPSFNSVTWLLSLTRCHSCITYYTFDQWRRNRLQNWFTKNTRTIRPLGYLPLCEVADTPSHIQGDELVFFSFHSSRDTICVTIHTRTTYSFIFQHTTRLDSEGTHSTHTASFSTRCKTYAVDRTTHWDYSSQWSARYRSGWVILGMSN